MSDVAALPETPAQEDLPPFLDGDAKEEMIREQYGFLITSVRPHVPTTNPKFADQTMYDIAFLTPSAIKYLESIGAAKDGKVKTASGEFVPATCPTWAENSRRWTLAQTHKKFRESQATAIGAKLALDDVNMVGPCWFTEIANADPSLSPTRVIVGAPQPPAVKSKKTNSAKPVNDGFVIDDDIPFHHDDAFKVAL